MKNPLEYTMIEIESLMRGDMESPQKEFTHLLAYVRFRQATLQAYQVQREIRLARTEAPALPRRTVQRLEADAECVLITMDETG